VISIRTVALPALFVAALAADASEAACDVKGTVTGVTGEPSAATLTRKGQTLRVAAGLRICGGDSLSAGARTVIRYETVTGRPAEVSGRTVRFAEREGQGNETDID
jgi:hypothetical protein